MKKNVTYGIAGAIGAAVIVAAIFATMGMTPNPTMTSVTNTNTIAAAKARVDAFIEKAAYSEISDATTPATAIDPNTGAVYVAFFRDDHDNNNGTLCTAV